MSAESDITVDIIHDTDSLHLMRPSTNRKSKRKTNGIDMSGLFGALSSNQSGKSNAEKPNGEMQSKLNDLFGVHVKELVDIKTAAQVAEEKRMDDTVVALVTLLIAPEELNDNDEDQKKRIAMLLRKYDLSPTEHIQLGTFYGAGTLDSKDSKPMDEKSKSALSDFQSRTMSSTVILTARGKYPIDGESDEAFTYEALAGVMSGFKDVMKDGYGCEIDGRKLNKSVRRCLTGVTKSAIEFADDVTSIDTIDLDL
jgi:hypothetical protein